MARVKGAMMTRKRRNKILKLAGVEINRKMLAELAVNDKAAFVQLTEMAKSKLA